MTIKLERFEVWSWSHGQTPKKFSVSKGKNSADIAVFEVSDTYSASEQRQRAHDYCDYMNKIVAATEEAYSQNQLVDTLKR